MTEQTGCPKCGRPIASTDTWVCPACGADLSMRTAAETGTPPGAGPAGDSGAGAAGPPPPAPAPPNSVPFEDPSLPFVQRLVRTAGMAFSDPVGLFSGMRGDSLGPPMLYGVIVGTITGMVAILWNMMFGGLAMLGGGAEADEFVLGTGLYMLFFFMMPIFAWVNLFISSAIYHVALLILGDGRRGFSITFRAVAYGSTPNVLSVVPICGAIAGGIWALVLVIVGGKLGHGTDWWRAILGYFLPTVICCCLAVWLATALGLFGALSR